MNGCAPGPRSRFILFRERKIRTTVESRFLEPPEETNWFEKSGVKLQCLTKERERLLVRVIWRIEKIRVREIGIPL